MPDRVLIVGGGQAALQCAVSLRSGGFQGRVAMFSEESHAPYMRPPLSKGFIRGEGAVEDFVFRTPESLKDDGIEFFGGQGVQRLNLRDRTIIAANREENFDILVLATGSRARTLSVPGSHLGSIHYLRTIGDAAKLGAALTEARNVVVVGGGFIGLEFASVARKLDARVTVVEAAPRLCGRAVSPAMSEWLLALHRDNGVSVRLSTGVRGFEELGRATAVHLDEGRIEADLVVVGIGSEPNDKLAAEAGLDVSAGIMVGTDLGTKASGVYAIGDCARFPVFPWMDTIRLESVQNAVDQAKHLAGCICEVPTEYRKVPWFWTEQFGYKVQMAGLSQYAQHCEVVQGDIPGRLNIEHSANDRVVAVDSVNDAKAHIAARKKLAAIYCCA